MTNYLKILIVIFILIINIAKTENFKNGYIEIISQEQYLNNKNITSCIIEGYIFNKKTNLKLAYGFIHVLNDKRIGTYIDSSGFFKFELIPGNYNFVIFSAGNEEFISETIDINPNTKVKFNVYLVPLQYKDTLFCK